DEPGAILEPHGLVMVLEPLNFRDHPGMFLTEIPQAYLICKAVGSPACKILFDMYHQQITEGNIIPNIDAAWDEIAYFQVGDVPGRNEPTTGEMHYRNIFRHIHAKGYTGILGMEHGKSRDGVAGERARIASYGYCAAFLSAHAHGAARDTYRHRARPRFRRCPRPLRPRAASAFPRSAGPSPGPRPATRSCAPRAPGRLPRPSRNAFSIRRARRSSPGCPPRTRVPCVRDARCRRSRQRR